MMFWIAYGYLSVSEAVSTAWSEAMKKARAVRHWHAGGSLREINRGRKYYA